MFVHLAAKGEAGRKQGERASNSFQQGGGPAADEARRTVLFFACVGRRVHAADERGKRTYHDAEW